MPEPGRKSDPAVVEATFVFDALTRCAQKHLAKIGCHGADAVVPGVSISAKDLAAQAIVKLHVKGWVPGTGAEDILPKGYVAVRNLFIDMVRSTKFKKTVNVEEAELEALVLDVGVEAPERLYEWPLIVKKIKALLTDPEEVKYLDCLLAGCKRTHDLADCLGVASLEEVEKIKKRIVYKAKRWVETWDTVQQ
jgi:hypothetical protein